MTKGVTLDLTGLVSGTTVNLRGDVSFAVSYWAGPLLKIGAASDTGTYIFNGHGTSDKLGAESDPDMNRRPRPRRTGRKLLGWLGRWRWRDETGTLFNIPCGWSESLMPVRLP